MGIIGKLFKNKQIVTIVALIVCFAILVFAYRYRVDKAIRAVSVPVATRDLKARERIDETCFETRKVAQSMLTDNVIRSEKQLIGDENNPTKYVNYNTFIPEGSMFYTSAVVTWDKMPDSAWADLEEGYTVFSLSLENLTAVSKNSIFPGDKIDLYFTGHEMGNKSRVFIGPLLNGITVLAVKDTDGNPIFKRGAGQKNAKALIFAVENEQFLFLKRAAAVRGEIIPVPRNEKYSIDPSTGESKGSDYIISYINANSYVSTDDTVVKNNTKVNVTE